MHARARMVRYRRGTLCLHRQVAAVRKRLKCVYVLFVLSILVSFTDVCLGVWVYLGAILETFHDYLENPAIRIALDPISPVIRGITVISQFPLYDISMYTLSFC